MTTLSNGTTTITPDIVDGYFSARTVRNVLHDILDRPDPDVSFATAATRAGALRLVFALEADALAAVAAHADAATWTLTDIDRPTLDMAYVVADGELSIALDDETRDIWIVTVPFREVIV